MSQHNQQTSINPWPGLSSYKEPKGEAPLLFCGRNREIEDLVPLIKDHIFTTLYGSSGLGKTSLLNAGVFPRLKKEGCFFPINLRLKLTPKESSFQEFIISTIKEEVKKANLNIVKQDAVISQYDLHMPTDISSSDYLWTFFALNHFTNAENQSITLILAFDQFEEVLLSRPEDTATLLKQVLFLMNNDNHLPSFELDGKTYHYEENYRFIVTLREDDLFMLEDIIDNNYLQSMKNNRYRLRDLKPEAAKEVIQIPGKDCICKEQIDDITNQIIEYSKDDDGTISSSMISFLCNRLYTKGNGFITSELVKENGGKTLKEFCQEQLAKLPPKEFEAFTKLLVDDGRRRQVLYDKFHKEVPSGDFLFEEESKLLDTVTIRKRANVEIIHDKFAAIIPEIKKELDAAAITEQLTKEKEKEQEKSKHYQKKVKRISFYSLLITVLAAIASPFIYNYAFPPAQWQLLLEEDQTVGSENYWKAEVSILNEMSDTLYPTRVLDKTNYQSAYQTQRVGKVRVIIQFLAGNFNTIDTLMSMSDTLSIPISRAYGRIKHEGRVIYGQSPGQPIKNAIVTIGNQITKTDRYGLFTAYVDQNDISADGTIIIFKNGYKLLNTKVGKGIPDYKLQPEDSKFFEKKLLAIEKQLDDSCFEMKGEIAGKPCQLKGYIKQDSIYGYYSYISRAKQERDSKFSKIIFSGRINSDKTFHLDCSDWVLNLEEMNGKINKDCSWEGYWRSYSTDLQKFKFIIPNR